MFHVKQPEVGDWDGLARRFRQLSILFFVLAGLFLLLAVGFFVRVFW